ncbi:MAG: hypothetical protein M1828_002801 [Chrysothrix sp. TS-e1954]|nr:MAG: hypothetical protein M1828_002801 [Chrysothrix sp. TS-e1954]
MAAIDSIFRSHRFSPGEEFITLFYVDDHSSFAPSSSGADGPRTSIGQDPIQALHAITPSSMLLHLALKDREGPQFTSCFQSFISAFEEAQRRKRKTTAIGKRKRPGSVKIGTIRISRHDSIFNFSRQDLLRMMRWFDREVDFMPLVGGDEWLIWGAVPRRNVTGWMRV